MQLKLLQRHASEIRCSRGADLSDQDQLVPATTSIAELHDIIQTVMGWHDCHLHVFKICGREYQAEEGSDDSSLWTSRLSRAFLDALHKELDADGSRRFSDRTIARVAARLKTCS